MEWIFSSTYLLCLIVMVSKTTKILEIVRYFFKYSTAGKPQKLTEFVANEILLKMLILLLLLSQPLKLSCKRKNRPSSILIGYTILRFQIITEINRYELEMVANQRSHIEILLIDLVSITWWNIDFEKKNNISKFHGIGRRTLFLFYD